MPNNIEGMIWLNIWDNFIHPLSIILLNEPEIIPTIPVASDVIKAQCHENKINRIKNPIEMTKIVDFDVSVFIFYPVILKKCINKRSNYTATPKYYQDCQEKQYDNNWCQPEFLSLFHKEPEVK